MDKTKDFFNLINEKIIELYYKEMDEFFKSSSPGSLLNSDIIILIMNIIDSVATQLFISIKNFLPDSEIDFDFIKVKLINSLSENFSKIKFYHLSEKGLVKLTFKQLNEIIENGSTKILLEDGSYINVTQDEVKFKKEDIKKLIEKEKEKNNKKNIIITPNHKH